MLLQKFATHCSVVKLNKMKWGCESDRKIFHLLHGVVVFNIWLLFLNGNITSDLWVGDARWYILGESCRLLQSCEPTMTVKGSTDIVPSCQLQAWIQRQLAFPTPCEGSRQLFLYQGKIIMYSVTHSNYTRLMFYFCCWTADFSLWGAFLFSWEKHRMCVWDHNALFPNSTCSMMTIQTFHNVVWCPP